MSLKPPASPTTGVPSLLDTLPFSGFVSVLRHGATGDGTTDDSDAFLAAYATGDPIYVPEGRYRLTEQFTSSVNAGGTTPLVLVGDGPGQTILLQDEDVRLINLGEALGSSVSITANVTAGDKTLTITSTTGLLAGNWIQIRSNEVAPGATTTSVVGELARILSVDSATGLTLYGPVEEDYLTSDTPIIQKAPMIDGCLLKDFTIENPNQGTYTSQVEAVRLNQVAGARIENVHFKYLDNPAMKIATCVDWSVDRVRFLDGSDDTNMLHYGVLAYNASRNGVVSNCFMNKGRHLFTTGAAASTPVPKHITVAHCHATGMTSTAFDTHEEARWIVFDNCTANNCMSNAFASRSPDTTFINPITVRTERAIVVAAGSDRAHVLGGRIDSTNELELTTAFGIHVQADDCTITGTRISGPYDQGIEVADGADRAHISRVDITLPGAGGTATCIRLNGGADHYVDGHFSEATTGLQATSTVTGLSLGVITHLNVTTPMNLNASTTYRRTYIADGIQTLSTDAAFSLTPVTSPLHTIHTGTLTADRAVTLSTTGAVRGLRWRITRTGGGAFNLTVGTGPLKALATNTWCEVTYDGSAWKLTAYGAL